MKFTKINSKILTAIFAAAVLLLNITPSFGDNSMFSNTANIKKFKSKIKKDIFYPADAKLEVPALAKDNKQSGSRSNLPGADAVNTGSTVEVKIIEKKNVLLMDENFRVEGIIKVGGRGCAMINSKLWYVGKPQLGYELIKLNDESVEIKTPDGRVLKCQLVKEGKVE